MFNPHHGFTVQEPLLIDLGNRSTTIHVNQLWQIQGLQMHVATTIEEVVSQTHVRFQPSRDLWEDEVTSRSNQKLCKWCSTPRHMELGCHLHNSLIDKKTSRARAISISFIYFSLLFFLLFPTLWWYILPILITLTLPQSPLILALPLYHKVDIVQEGDG